MSGVSVPGHGVLNVLFVVTEHDSVYAFDADSPPGSNATPLWQSSFIKPGAGITTVPAGDVDCMSIVPEIGITSTPVIDPVTGTLYVCAKTKESNDSGANYFYRLHALDVTTGAERPGSPATIQGAVQGTANDVDGTGNIVFNALLHLNRPGLLLSKGVVYIAFASNCDITPYHGWMFGFDALTLAPAGILMTTPNGTGAESGRPVAHPPRMRMATSM